jgi:hypothetical protein
MSMSLQSGMATQDRYMKQLRRALDVSVSAQFAAGPHTEVLLEVSRLPLALSRWLTALL